MKKVLFCVGNPLFLLHVWMKGPTVLNFFVHKHGACRLNILTNTIQPSGALSVKRSPVHINVRESNFVGSL